MKFLFEISKEHPTIPISEITHTLSALNIEFEIIEKNKDVLLVESLNLKPYIGILSKRVAYSFYIDQFFFSSKPIKKEIVKKAKQTHIPADHTLAVKYKNRSKKVNSKNIVETLANVYTQKNKVDLEKPDIEIRALITDKKIYVGVKKSEIKRSDFEKRKVQNRPFFQPISLHPKLARALVNLSGIKENGTLLDPFCGTGGIILEAGLIGAKIIGSDIEDKMIKGCKKTLDHYKIKDYYLFQSDISQIDEKIDFKVDAIVTDLPYGKATTTKGENILDLYDRSFHSFKKYLKKGKKLVIGTSERKIIDIGRKYLRLEEIHDFKTHKSLTRSFAIYQKI